MEMLQSAIAEAWYTLDTPEFPVMTFLIGYLTRLLGYISKGSSHSSLVLLLASIITHRPVPRRAAGFPRAGNTNKKALADGDAAKLMHVHPAAECFFELWQPIAELLKLCGDVRARSTVGEWLCAGSDRRWPTQRGVSVRLQAIFLMHRLIEMVGPALLTLDPPVLAPTLVTLLSLASSASLLLVLAGSPRRSLTACGPPRAHSVAGQPGGPVQTTADPGLHVAGRGAGLDTAIGAGHDLLHDCSADGALPPPDGGECGNR